MIKLYSTETCAYCKMAGIVLQKLGREYEEVKLDDNESLRNELSEKLGGITVPIIEVDGQYIKGFNPQRMKEVLGG